MAKKRKVFVSILCAILALLILVPVLSIILGAARASAVSQWEIDNLKEQQSEIADKKSTLKGQIDDLEAQQAAVLEQKAALDEQNELTRQEIELINEQISLYEKLVAAKEVELTEAEEAEREQMEAYRTHLRAMEENGVISYLEILFQAKSFSDLLSRIDDIAEIMAYDKRLEDDCIAAKEHVQTVKAEYEATQAEYEASKVELLAQKAQLESDIEAAYKAIAALEDDIEIARTEYEENEKAEIEFQSQIDALMAELKRQEEAARQQQLLQQQQQQNSGGTTVTTPVVTPAVGNFIWPYPQNNYVSSGYGYRFHPIFQENRMHYGIDIGGTAGQQVVAIAAGTVSVATYNSSYGNYVMINHGNGTASLYAHMESLAVSAGDTVTQGQTVGYVGSTGWSTGPHLHFEIRVNGSTTDPLAYYSSGTYVKGF